MFLNKYKHNIYEAIRDTQGAFYGYIPLGMAFGILFQTLHYSWYYAVLLSMLVYAGSMQFIAVPMLAVHSSLIEFGITTFLVNLRHVFYGISFLDRFKFKLFLKYYLVFGLTDESYSIMTSNKSKHCDKTYEILVVILCHAYWIIGTVLGVIFYSKLQHINLSFLYFSLPALFTVLTVEAYKKLPSIIPIFSAIMGLLICKFIHLSNYLSYSMLISSILILLCTKRQKGITTP